MEYEEFLGLEPYKLAKSDKHAALTEVLQNLTKKHLEACPAYGDILRAWGFRLENVYGYEDIPFLPARLFKEYDLKSVNSENIVKTMTSSGTTGQQVSKIFLDRATSANQIKVMARIVSDFLGTKRLPMIILDTSAVLRDRAMFSARGAGILGFSMFGRDRIYALEEDMRLDVDGVQFFLHKHEGENVFLFGFTFMIWQHFYRELQRLGKEGISLDLSRGIMLHGGGWKSLVSEAVAAEEFRSCLQDVCGIRRIYNYYGMVEQTGSIYMECEYGHLHTSVFSDVIIRNPKDWSVQPQGEKGVIEVVSCLPLSYPGHILLTEDEGIVDGEDDCPCGRKGKYFRVLGRVKNAEIRGCSDTYADKFASQ